MTVSMSSTHRTAIPTFLPSLLLGTTRPSMPSATTPLPPPSTLPRVTPRMSLPTPDHSPPDEPDSTPADDMRVFRRGAHRHDSSDLLPFDVKVISPPPRRLGRFQLDPRTHCGDIVEHAGRHFVVKSVSMQYKYSAGAYRVVRKTIEVKSLARKAIEVYLERIMHDS
eukprot:GFKZ01000015.1.p3 GENE.GFKZ01000015.1~~GFKZ01000015.1.p3  ORF type:complete len:167 (+),score=21.42 GFKZ01000015.1:969-1469(+)